MKINALATLVSGIIVRSRCDLSVEKQTQADIEKAFAQLGGHNIGWQREYRLGDRDIVDFLIDGRLALEVKLKRHRKVEVFRQLERYADYSRVEATMLATNLSMGLPEEIAGKPAYYVSLGQAWL